MEHARAVIIGGGVGGTSVAYHLAERGWRDVILLDRAELTSGSTFHSAGLVGQLRSSVTLTRMMVDGVALYRRLAAETGIDPGWREVGSLRLASSDERMEELRRQAGWASAFGLTLELVGPDEAHDRFPLMSTEGVRGAAWLPTDGWLDPSGLALSLAAGARAGGVDIRQHHRVVAIERAAGRVTGLTVEHAGERYTIATELVVNAGGMFAAEIGRLAGVTVPIIPMAHQYLFSDALEGVHADLPQLRDPDNLVYFREDLGGLLFGGYERHPAPWGLDGIPADFNGRLLAPDTARLDEIMEGAVRRVPSLAQAGVRRVVNGPEAFTPDNEFILGESEVPGFWVAAGFCAHGIAGAAGVGRQVASWIVDGEPELDVWRMDIRRFGAAYRSQRYTLARTTEVYATYYDIHYPNEERQAGRPLRMSPAYDALVALGAVFGEKSGWERPNWFEPNADDPRFGGRAVLEALRPHGWAGRHWSPAIAAEALATRTAAALFDESSFAKLEVDGPGALAFLQRVSGNDVDRPVGSVVYTQLLDRRGGVQADLTVTRVGPSTFLLVTGTASGNHDVAWLRSHMPRDGSVAIRDLTSSRVCFGLWGPRARDVLAALTSEPLDQDGFPYLTAREIAVGSVPVLALRVTYVGESGWELYAPDRVRARALGEPLGGRSTARHGRCRLPRDRCAADREGLSGLVGRRDARRDAV